LALLNNLLTSSLVKTSGISLGIFGVLNLTISLFNTFLNELLIADLFRAIALGDNFLSKIKWTRYLLTSSWLISSGGFLV